MPLARRAVLAGAGAAAVALTARGARALADVHSAYVAGSKGLTLWRVNTGDGLMTRLGVVADMQATWLARHPHGSALYAVAAGAPNGQIGAFAIEHAGETLAKLGSVAAQGAAPSHASVHPSGKFLLVTCGGGSVAVYPIKDNGALDAASDVQAGGAASGLGGMVAADPRGRFIVVTDSAGDRILRFTLDAGSGKLAPAGDPVTVPAGSAPDRFVFGQHGRVLHVLQRQAGTVTTYDDAAETGALKPVQTVSALPPGYAGGFAASDLVMQADGRFLYASVRMHDAITIFAVGDGGRLTRIGESWTRADDPASFTIAPDGATLFVCNQRAGALTAFRVSHLSGAVDFLGHYAAVDGPACMVFA